MKLIYTFLKQYFSIFKSKMGTIFVKIPLSGLLCLENLSTSYAAKEIAELISIIMTTIKGQIVR